MDEEFEIEFEEYLEEIVFECYECGWSGTDCYKQVADLWDTDEEQSLCPECGNLIG